MTLKNIDISGQAADYAWVAGVCEQFGVLMIGDAAESLGARHDLGMAGSFGDVLLASFNGNKIMTTSGGGMLLTDNGEHAQRVRYRALAASADGIELVEDVPWGRSNSWLSIIRLNVGTDPEQPESLRKWLEQMDIESRHVWKPMHRQPVFRDAKSILNGNADRLFAGALCLPSGSLLSPSSIDLVCERVLSWCDARRG